MAKITSRSFRLGGITIASELDLPGLPQVVTRSADVTLRIGKPPSIMEDALEVEPRCLANGREYLHVFPGIASFYIREGDLIIVEPLDMNKLDELRSLLHAEIFAVLFSRRGLLPLHASAVSMGGKVFCFLGGSGCGKSSLAAFLCRRGYRVVADDLTLLRIREGVTEVTPCAPWLKLWADTLGSLEQSVDGLELISGKDSKYRLPIAPKAGDPEESLSLAGLFVLESTPGGQAVISQLEPAAAVTKLMLHSYPILLIHKLGGNAELFRQCAVILEQVPMWTFTRPWDLASVEISLDTLQAHMGQHHG